MLEHLVTVMRFRSRSWRRKPKIVGAHGAGAERDSQAAENHHRD